MPRHVIVITDLDNTLYNWVDFFAPSFRAIVHGLNKATKIPEPVISESFRKVFQERGSLEYPVAAQELALFADRDTDECQKLNRIIFGAFHTVSNARLRLYEGALPFLHWCHRNNVPVLALTNAPLTVARRRLIQLGVNGYFSALAAPDIFQKAPAESDETHSLFQPEDATNLRKPDEKCRLLYPLKSTEVKPSGIGFKRILDDWQVGNATILAVGDSLKKDLAPAHPLGIKTVWAKFGTNIDKGNLETLFGITPWTAEQVQTAYSEEFTPDYTAENWESVELIVKNLVSAPAS